MAAKRSLTPEQIKDAYARCGISLDRVAQNGEVKVRCPFHEDSKPSMSVNVRTGLWNCYAGCGGGTVIDFVRREDRVDYKTAAATVYGRVPKAASRIQVTYDYCDENGKLLFQVVRYDPKDFKPRRPDPNSAGRWIYGLTGVRRVPYRLPELLAAAQNNSEINPVFVVEGEKTSKVYAPWG